MQFLWKVFVTSLVFLFIGCGGGGSSSQTNLTETTDSSLVYEGKTTPMTFDQETSKKVISSFVNSSALNQVISTDTTSNKTSNVFAKQSKISNGSVSGNVDFELTEIDNVTHKLVATFDNYNDGTSETMTGRVVYTIVYENSQRTIINQMNMDIDLLTLKSSENSIILDGLLVAYVDNSTGNIRYVYNTVSKDNNTNEMSKFENFEVLLDAEDRPLSYKGKIYYSQEGYVLVSTPIELSYSDLTNTPDVGGEIHFEGDDAIVKERIAYDGRVRVEIDNGKDGTVDEFEVYTASTMEVVPNSAPVVTVSFPKEIFTDTNLSEVVNVNIYDPDLDEFSTSYTWQINNEVKSSSLVLSTALFKKHDNLKLTIEAEDNRVGEKKKTTESKTQTVLNSRPVITSNFQKLSLTLGESKILDYTISDADNDEVEVTWEHTYGFDNENLEEYLTFSDFDCSHALQEYNTEHTLSYENLTIREQEDIRDTLCQEEFTTKLNSNFIEDGTFLAVTTGFFKHKMIVSDGDYNRTKRLASEISQMDLIESEEYNHDDFTYNSTHNVYMEDMNNDGNKDLIHITGLDPFADKEPLFVIEYRDGKTLLERREYNITNLTSYDLDNYYIADLNGDEKLDVLFVYNNVNDTSDNTSYGKILQKEDGTFEDIIKFSLDNRDSVLIENIIHDSGSEIIILRADNFESLNEVKIYSEEENITIPINLPTAIGSRILSTQILSHDLDSNLKEDIIIVNNSFVEGSELIFTCSVLSQETNGSFSEKIYTTKLKDNLTVSDYETIQNVKIADIDDNQNIWIVQSSKSIYLMKLENGELVILKTIEYEPNSYKEEIQIFNPVDINSDGKDDIVIALGGSNNKPLNILIQTDDLEFLPIQEYNFTNFGNSFNGNSSSVLGDIEGDGKIELFMTTGEENLSVLYFK